MVAFGFLDSWTVLIFVVLTVPTDYIKFFKLVKMCTYAYIEKKTFDKNPFSILVSM